MNDIIENQCFVVDNMGDPYPGETGIYAVEDEVVLIRDQHYARDNSGIGIYAVEDEVVLVRDQQLTVDNKVILIRESALCGG